jgi:hypothetical protein
MAALPGAIELLSNQPPVPSQDGGWFGDASHLSQVLATEPSANFG